MDAVKVAAGGLLIAISLAMVAQTGTVTRAPFSMAALGAIGLSAATLLVDSVTA